MNKRMRITVEGDNGAVLVDHIRVLRAVKEASIRRVMSRWTNYYKQRYYGVWRSIKVTPADWTVLP